MKFRKTIVLFLIGSSLLAGCKKEEKILLLSNSDFSLYGDVSDEHLFYVPTLEEFTNLYNSNLNYIIMFSDEGCSACQQFAPIIEKYIKNTHQLVVKIDGVDKYKIQEEYKDKFFPDSGILNPSIFVKENNDNLYKVDYSSYMKTYRVFNKHMNSRYETSKCAYFCGEIARKSPVISNFSLVKFQSNDTFKNKISPKLLGSEKNVFIESNFEENSLSIFEQNSDGKFEQKNTVEITDELSEEIILNYL